MATEQELAEKLLTDESFREELKKDPKGTLKAHGIDVPDGVEIEVVETTPAKHYIVMPPLQTGELSEEQLSGVQGGTGIFPMTLYC